MKRRIDFEIWVAAVLLSIVCECYHARADDWPLVRGDAQGTGVAHATLPDAPALLWKYSAGKDAGFEAPAVSADGVVYVGDNAGTFHAIRLTDHTEVWKKEFAESGFTAGASFESDRLYVGDMNGAIRCLSAMDGKELWSQKLEGEVHAAPSINDGDVLFTCEAGTLSCRNKQDGAERWQFHIEAPLRCTPTISSGRAAVAGCDSNLHWVDVANGKETEIVEIDAPTGSTPAMRNDHVFFGTEGGTFYGISEPAAEKKSAVAWTYLDPQRNQPIRAAAAVNDELVVYGGQGKAIYGLDPTNGKEKWRVTTRSRVESSPVIVGNRVVAATAAGKIYLLDAATGDVVWEYDAGGSFVASPAIVDNKIVIGNTDGTLYCFGTDSKKPTTKDTNDTKDEKKASEEH
jgi:outer membrane protein assembly factor BamB